MTKQELIVERTARNFDLLNESYYTKEQCRMLLNEMKEQLFLLDVSNCAEVEDKPSPLKYAFSNEYIYWKYLESTKEGFDLGKSKLSEAKKGNCLQH